MAVLLVNTDQVTGHINEDIYGQFLEHINHSVVDGLFAEQIRGRGFEGDDFESYWELSGDQGNVAIADIKFKNGEKSLRLEVDNNEVGILQGRIYLEEGYTYNGFIWLKPEEGSVKVALHVKDSENNLIAMIPLKTAGSDWQELAYSFSNPKTDAQASLEIVAEGQGSVLMDYISLMRSDIREGGRAARLLQHISGKMALGHMYRVHSIPVFGEVTRITTDLELMNFWTSAIN